MTFKFQNTAKVIGTTRSGKPIYDSPNHSSHKDFSRADHDDARASHASTAFKIEEKGGKTAAHDSNSHRLRAGQHSRMIDDAGWKEHNARQAKKSES